MKTATETKRTPEPGGAEARANRSFFNSEMVDPAMNRKKGWWSALVIFIGAAFSLAVLTGCGILSPEPYINTNYYDIGFPDASRGKLTKQVRIKPITVKGPYQNRMVFRMTDTQLAFDEYNRWSPSPTSMLERYLLMAYDMETSEKAPKTAWELTGEILRFEADLNKKTVDLDLYVTIRKEKSNSVALEKLFRKQVVVDSVTGNSFAAGMRKAVNQILVDLDKELSKLD